MSVPSSKVTTTWDSPNFETERSCSRRGMPLIFCSMGKVICCSISSELSDGAVVLIWTWTGVVSGKASMSRWASAKTPAAALAATARITQKRCRSEKSITQFSTGLPPHGVVAGSPTGLLLLAVRSALAEIVLEQLRAEHAAASGRDDLARQHAGDDLGVVVVLG